MDCVFSVFSFSGSLLRSSSTQLLLVLFFFAFYTAPFSSKHFFLGHLFFLVVLLSLVLSMIAFCYEHFFWGLCCGIVPPSCLSLVTVFFLPLTGLVGVRVFLYFPFLFCLHFSLSCCSGLISSVSSVVGSFLSSECDFFTLFSWAIFYQTYFFIPPPPPPPV